MIFKNIFKLSILIFLISLAVSKEITDDCLDINNLLTEKDPDHFLYESSVVECKVNDNGEINKL